MWIHLTSGFWKIEEISVRKQFQIYVKISNKYECEMKLNLKLIAMRSHTNNQLILF